MTWKDELGELFAGYVNQQTLEEGVDAMVFVSAGNAAYHRRFCKALEEGIAACGRGDEEVLPLVNGSGYRVQTIREALDLLMEFRARYLERYDQAIGRAAQ